MIPSPVVCAPRRPAHTANVRQQACVPSGIDSQTCQRCLDFLRQVLWHHYHPTAHTIAERLARQQTATATTSPSRRHRTFNVTSIPCMMPHDLSPPVASLLLLYHHPAPIPTSPHRRRTASSVQCRAAHATLDRSNRSNRLYEHIRKIHPDIDIEAIKKLESKKRGESRGRYRDEGRRKEVARRNRSRGRKAHVNRSSGIVHPSESSEAGASDQEDDSESSSESRWSLIVGSSIG